MTYRYPIFPRMAAPTSVPAMMIDVLVALLPTVGMSIYLFGWQVVFPIVLSIGTCVMFQCLYGLMTHRVHPTDLSPWVTGLLLALCYPSDISLFAVPLGSFFAIIVVKELYGGLGCNFLNPALAGRMFLASSPLLMTRFTTPKPLIPQGMDALSSATPLSALHQGILPTESVEELILGFHGGSLGEGSTLMLLLGAVYLLLRRVISPTIPVTFLGTVALISLLFSPEGIAPTTWMVAQLCSGGLMLGAFFMATDPVTSPVSFTSQVVFGMGCGVLTMLLRTFGSYPEGVGFAILTMNGLVWVLDYVGAPRRMGSGHLDSIKEECSNIGVHFGGNPLTLLVKKEKENASKKIATVPGERYVEGLPKAMKSVLIYAVILLVTLGGVSWTYSWTQLEIHRNNELENLKLLSQAMPQADFISETPYTHPSFETLYAAYQDQTQVGYCVELKGNGFVGELTLLVGVGLDGSVTGVAVKEHKETLHIGTEVLKQETLSLFQGKSGTLSLQGENAIDTISGATVTLTAVMECVNEALMVGQLMNQVGGLELLLDVVE